MKFSQRIGKNSVRTALQIDSMDDTLRKQLWNTVVKFGFSHESCEAIWKDFFYYPIDELPMCDIFVYHSMDEGHNESVIDIDKIRKIVKEWYFKTETEWYEIYDWVEFVALQFNHDEDNNFNSIIEERINSINLVFTNNLSGYRFINVIIAPITSEEEIKEIEEALVNVDKWSSVTTHIEAALSLISNKKNPDYRNSIKESISAVESFCKIITMDDKATLGKALVTIERKYPIHSALKNAFSAIYGYTSDNGGIRHALLEGDSEIKFEDAKFMLVSCSAFINYLKAKTV